MASCSSVISRYAVVSTAKGTSLSNGFTAVWSRRLSIPEYVNDGGRGSRDNAAVSPLTVSAVIPTYNRAHLLPRSIGSALAALGPGDEVIVVDDGSTDGTDELVKSYGDPVRLVRGAHRGAGAARNLGYAAAAGPLVAFLDSDDEWFPDKIELQRSLFESWPELVYCCSDFSIQLSSGGERHRWLALWMDRARPLA